jgi:16S rRNA (adenine1518-N6/adenine1519-N6)-dimethyltransferase
MTERFEHKKSLGQHFLNSRAIPDRMCKAANLQTGDLVVEIGPGTGALTAILLEHPVTVIAIETDERAIAHLKARFDPEIRSKRLIILDADVRELDPASLGLSDHQYKVVANIPYYLSGLLFRTFLESICQPSDLVFLVQREVATRITRDPKSSLLSLSVAAFGNPSYICTVGKGHFTPPPKVDSAVVAVRTISRDRLAGIDPKHFFDILHLGFGQKRKQLVGNLSRMYERSLITTTLQSLGLAPTIRAEDIDLPTWVRLVLALATHHKSTT